MSLTIQRTQWHQSHVFAETFTKYFFLCEGKKQTDRAAMCLTCPYLSSLFLLAETWWGGASKKTTLRRLWEEGGHSITDPTTLSGSGRNFIILMTANNLLSSSAFIHPNPNKRIWFLSGTSLKREGGRITRVPSWSSDRRHNNKTRTFNYLIGPG